MGAKSSALSYETQQQSLQFEDYSFRLQFSEFIGKSVHDMPILIISAAASFQIIMFTEITKNDKVLALGLIWITVGLIVCYCVVMLANFLIQLRFDSSLYQIKIPGYPSLQPQWFKFASFAIDAAAICFVLVMVLADLDLFL